MSESDINTQIENPGCLKHYGTRSNKKKLYHKYRKIPGTKNEIKYKVYRNTLNHVLKVAE